MASALGAAPIMTQLFIEVDLELKRVRIGPFRFVAETAWLDYPLPPDFLS
jgi:hypothetical protein